MPEWSFAAAEDPFKLYRCHPTKTCNKSLHRARAIAEITKMTVERRSYKFRLIWLKERRLGKFQRAVRDWIVESAEADRARMREILAV